MTRVFGRARFAGLCLAVAAALAAGCGEPDRSGAAAPSRGEFRRPAYTDKTPEEWLELLRHRSAQARNLAIDALMQYGKPCVPGLIGVLEDRTAGPGRLAAARALGAIGRDAEAAVPALATALQDRAWSDRDGAAEALGAVRSQPDVALPALANALKDPDQRVRAVAARALGRIGSADHGAVDSLCAALEDDDLNVRADAAGALGLIRPPATAAVPALEKAARSQEFVVAQAAEEALKAIRGR